jgi:hypothetical protein
VKFLYLKFCSEWFLQFLGVYTSWVCWAGGGVGRTGPATLKSHPLTSSYCINLTTLISFQSFKDRDVVQYSTLSLSCGRGTLRRHYAPLPSRLLPDGGPSKRVGPFRPPRSARG